MGEAQYLKVQTDPRVISICFAFHLIFSDKLRSAVKKSGFLSLYIYIERERLRYLGKKVISRMIKQRKRRTKEC